jgi:tetratricopeptide (TPR) repeat protein
MVLWTICPVLIVAAIGLSIYKKWKEKNHPFTQIEELAASGDLKGALESYRDYEMAHGPSQVLYSNMGVICSQMDEAEKALEYYRKAEECGKSTLWIMINKATALSKLGRNEEAIELMEECVRQEPRQIACVCSLAFLYADAGQLENAQQMLDLAKKLKKKMAAGTSQLKPLFDQLKETQKKVAELAKARGEAPGSPPAL